MAFPARNPKQVNAVLMQPHWRRIHAGTVGRHDSGALDLLALRALHRISPNLLSGGGGHQLDPVVTTFGPGSMLDLPDTAVIVSGLDHWNYDGGEGWCRNTNSKSD